MRRPQRRWIAVAMVAVLVGALLGGVVIAKRFGGSTAPAPLARSSPSPPTASSATQTKRTVPQQIMVRHADRDGRLDVEGALELFSYAFAPLPGITLPSGSSDTPRLWNDTALDSMLAHFPELTVAQRQRVLSFLDTSTTQPSATPASTAGTAGIPRLASYPQNLYAVTAQQQVQVRVQQAILEEGTRLGHTLQDAGVSNVNTAVQAVLSNEQPTTQAGDAGAWTWATSGTAAIDPNSSDPPGSISGKPSSCSIYFPPSFWQHLTWTPGGVQFETLYHEVFHCFQFLVLGSTDLGIAYTAPDWLIEGSAEWAGDSMSGYDDPTWATVLKDNTPYGYLNNPRTGLNDESHAAFGLFYEVEYLGRSLWPAWWDIWKTAAAGGWGTSEWFDAVAGDHRTALSNAWGSSFFEDTGLGHDWTELAAHQTTAFQNVASLFSGTLDVAAVPYSTYQVSVPAQGPGNLVVIVTATGTPRYIDGAGHEGIGQDSVALCWSDCSTAQCKGGGGASRPGVVNVAGSVRWALTALAGGGAAGLATVTAGEFCKRDWRPKPGPPCSSDCAGSNGDPHISTIDSRRYDFQAAGEFVLLRSADGSLEIQGRQEPFDSPGHLGITVNTAVAARVGTHRVSVSASQAEGTGGTSTTATTLETHLDGSAISTTSAVDLGGGGSLTVHSNGVALRFPDGTMLWALPVPPYGINIEVLPSAALRASGTGVLGRTPLGLRYPPLPDGTGIHFGASVAQELDYKYRRFADAWRVTDHDTLFDYRAGRSTASYTVPGFIPEAGLTTALVPDPTQRSRSESTCQAVSAVELHDDCVFDVTTSGNSAFAAGYQGTQSFQQEGTTALDQGTSGQTTAPGVNLGPAPAGLTQVLANVQGLKGSVLGPDGRFYATVVEPAATFEILAIDPASASVRARATLNGVSGLHDGLVYVSGSLWFVVADLGGRCSVDRFDPATLREQAAITLSSCPTATPAIAAVAGTVWTNSVGPSSGRGQLLRIDPSTNTVVGTVAVSTGEVQSIGDQQQAGTLLTSDTALFWGDGTTYYRLQSPWTTTVDLHSPTGRGLPSGDGLWFEVLGSANLYGGSGGGQQASVALNGPLAGADAKNLYVVRAGPEQEDDLWRYPIDGSSPVQIAGAPSGTIAAWRTADAVAFVITTHDVLALDIDQPPGPQGSSEQQPGLYLVASPLLTAG